MGRAKTSDLVIGQILIPKDTPKGDPQRRLAWAKAGFPGVLVVSRSTDASGDVETIRQVRSGYYDGWQRSAQVMLLEQWELWNT